MIIIRRYAEIESRELFHRLQDVFAPWTEITYNYKEGDTNDESNEESRCDNTCLNN